MKTNLTLSAIVISVLLITNANAAKRNSSPQEECLSAQCFAQVGCPTCSVKAIRASIYGQRVHSKGDGSEWDYACGAMLHVKGPTERFLKECFGK